MAEPSDLRTADNHWVMASTEGFVVETVGPEQDPGTPAGGAPTAGQVQSYGGADSHGQLSQGVGEGFQSSASSNLEGFQDSKVPGATTIPTSLTQVEGEPVGAPQESAHLNIPPEDGLDAGDVDFKAPSFASKAEEDVSCSSSEDDVEGLRKRQVREVRPAAGVTDPVEAAQAEGETWLTLNRCIMGALALVGLGLLVVSGFGFDTEDGVLETLERRDVAGGDKPTLQSVDDIKDWMKEHMEGVTEDPQPLQAMSTVLDRLAKENQDIRLMQAELQAQKEELQALLNKSEGEKMSVGSKQQNLLEENLRLKESLLKEETAHLSAQEELQALKEKLQVWEEPGIDPASFAAENAKLKAERDAEGLKIEGFLSQKETLVAEAQMLRQELDKQRTLLASIRQDLENLTSNSAASNPDAESIQFIESLEDIGIRLKSELQRSENWEKNYVQDKQRQRERTSRSKKGGSQLESVVFPNTSVPPGEKLEGSTQTFRSTISPLKESARSFIRSERKEKWKETGQDWKEGKHKKHAHVESEDESMHKRHHHRQVGNDPQEHKSAEFVGQKNEWKGILKEGKWKDRAEAWRERAAEHHHTDSEKRREGKDQPERVRNGLHQHKEHQASQEGMLRKEWDAQENRPQWQKPKEAEKREHRHHDHNKFWKKLSDHQYRVPEGCSGVADCARKDGIDLFNVELAPVDKREFQQLMREFLELQELAKYLPELDGFMSKFFDGDVFMHDKMRFRDFVNDVEDYLEDIASKEKGDDDAVDDFDKHVFKHYFGEAAVKKRSSKKSVHKTKFQKDNGEEVGSEPLEVSSKHVKTEQRMKRSSNAHPKISKPMTDGQEMTEQHSKQHHDSKPFSHNKHVKGHETGRENKRNLNDKQSDHRHEDTKPLKNGKNLKERQSDQRQDDSNRSKNKQNHKETQPEHDHDGSKSLKRLKHSKERQTYHSHNDSRHENNPNPRQSHYHSDDDFQHEKQPKQKQSDHGHDDSKHERQPYLSCDDPDHVKHPKEKPSSHSYNGTKHETSRKEKPFVHPHDTISPKNDKNHKERQAHHCHHDSKHENFKERQFTHHHDDSIPFHLEKDSNERESHHHHHDSKHEKYHKESQSPERHDGSEPLIGHIHMKQGHFSKDDKDFKKFDKKINKNEGQHGLQHEKQSHSTCGKHEKEDRPSHQSRDDLNTFRPKKHHKEPHSEHHHHSGPKVFCDDKSSHKHHQKEGQQRGRQSGHSDVEGHK
ncbi:pre-B-cell leukemia transcription factor-interacting protein 1 isoform X2 [Ambystoma mexicanum]|uniref:pre-B-cell leukemia transcription factor-interacting protein 1 isoform X2 n=1 Tax=Ambystoma mexicanum TaxID=8296 RepID=UPI0037E73D0A